MKTNKPITQKIEMPTSYNIDGSVAESTIIEKLYDRLVVNLNVKGRATNGNGSVINSGYVEFKKCTEDGYITVSNNIENC